LPDVGHSSELPHETCDQFLDRKEKEYKALEAQAIRDQPADEHAGEFMSMEDGLTWQQYRKARQELCVQEELSIFGGRLHLPASSERDCGDGQASHESDSLSGLLNLEEDESYHIAACLDLATQSGLLVPPALPDLPPCVFAPQCVKEEDTRPPPLFGSLLGDPAPAAGRLPFGAGSDVAFSPCCTSLLVSSPVVPFVFGCRAGTGEHPSSDDWSQQHHLEDK